MSELRPHDEIVLIGVDWGSTRLRAHAFARDGRVLASCQNDRGMSTLTSPAMFVDALDELLAPRSDQAGLHIPGVPILVAGMAGARGGWHEVPYVGLPADADTLAAMLQTVEFHNHRIAIVPGTCTGTAAGFSDVMRGEETQALGLCDDACRVIAPGTHSKWLQLSDGRIEGFATYPTGEVYALLMQHSLLGRGLPAQAWSDEGFQAGLDAARAYPDWLHQLFGVRARQVRDALALSQLPAFLSGLLIGYELIAALDTDSESPLTIVGGAQLTAIYARALAIFGVTSSCVDGDSAFCRGVWRIAKAARYA